MNIETDFINPNLLPILPSGKRLKEVLGLSDFKYVWIRKILNFPISTYIVIYDSKYPNLFIPMSQVKHLKAFGFDRLIWSAGKENMKKFIYSPPVKIEKYNKKISSKSVIIRYDLAGEYFASHDVSK